MAFSSLGFEFQIQIQIFSGSAKSSVSKQLEAFPGSEDALGERQLNLQSKIFHRKVHKCSLIVTTRL
jgi:hypothetical protein